MNPDNETVYTLEVFARISGVDQETILHYQEQGFIRARPGAGGHFDDEALRTLRRIEHLRETCGVNETGLRLMLDLLDEVERLRDERHPVL
jgi:MerR family transcriptional regulator/heat shock protein HspR